MQSERLSACVRPGAEVKRPSYSDAERTRFVKSGLNFVRPTRCLPSVDCTEVGYPGENKSPAMHVRRSIYPIMPLFAPSLGSHHVPHHASASVPLTEIERRLSVQCDPARKYRVHSQYAARCGVWGSSGGRTLTKPMSALFSLKH
jgi:hypothetical protein